MPRAGDPNREKAEQLYTQSNGTMSLKEIAEQLGISDGTVRGWKSRYKWDKKINATLQSDECSATNVTQRDKPMYDPKTAHRDADFDVSSMLPDVMQRDNGLTPKQQFFVLSYLRDFNATRAAMEAGYSKKTAYAIGWELLRKPEIQAEIQYQKQTMADELGISVQRVIAEYMKIAFTDISDLIDFGQREVQAMGMMGPLKDEEGNPVMKTVNFVDFKDSGSIDGSVISEVKQGKEGVSIKLHDKMRALKELEKYLNYMDEETRLKVKKMQSEVDYIQSKIPNKDGIDPNAQITALADLINNPAPERVLPDD